MRSDIRRNSSLAAVSKLKVTHVRVTHKWVERVPTYYYSVLVAHPHLGCDYLCPTCIEVELMETPDTDGVCESSWWFLFWKHLHDTRSFRIGEEGAAVQWDISLSLTKYLHIKVNFLIQDSSYRTRLRQVRHINPALVVASQYSGDSNGSTEGLPKHSFTRSPSACVAVFAKGNMVGSVIAGVPNRPTLGIDDVAKTCLLEYDTSIVAPRTPKVR